MARRPTDSLIFDTLHLEGGLFVPAVLEKAARGEHTAQKAADYALPKGLNLTDEQGRAFRIALALGKAFETTRARADVNAARATTGFVIELLRDALGYADLAACTAPIVLTDRAYPITAFACAGRVPVIVAPHGLDLDAPDERFAIQGSGARRRSAYQLAQQFLNAEPACAWAIVTNGRQLRLVRDADTLTRPAFLEADLDLILRAQRYPDFAAVWRLFHATRAGATDTPSEACPWEAWKKEGQEQGQRVREGLRTGVTEALLALGTGFIAHPANESLRTRLDSGALTKDAYFQQLLRLVYRCLFLFTVEERGLLHSLDDSAAARSARETYARGYALRRLRDRALRRSGFDRHSDLWTGTSVVFRGLAYGEARIALPALGGLFAPLQCPDLDQAQLENRHLLAAMRELRWSRKGGSLAAIDYRNMGPEELGSVYESLLELVPTIDLPARRFGFVGLTDEGNTDGNSRKTTGSYYTPEDPVQELLKSALEPVIAQKLAAHPADPARALLEISVVDIACGSGHFLLAAARRLAEKLAELRAVDGAVTPVDYRRALREVIAHCIYGVDRNPMALELARTALWREGFEPGQPLSFLDHHLVCGDALLGLTDFAILAKGIPADAFKPLAGDSKTITKALATENRAALKELEKRSSGPELFAQTDTADLLAELRALDALPETNPLEVECKAAAYTTFLRHASDSRLAQAADLVVAAFLAPKATESDRARCPTTQTLADLLYPRQGSTVPPATLAHARELCREARVLHWPLAFAAIFARGGFDCVLGNPPWDMLQLDPQEYFATRAPHVAKAQNMAARDKEIAALKEANDPLYRDYSLALRITEATQAFAHAADRFKYSGRGRINLASLFTESCFNLNSELGRVGIICPSGIASDSFTQHLWTHFTGQKRLVSFWSFENEEFIFPAVHHAFKFCLLTLAGAAIDVDPEFIFFARQVDALENHHRRFRLSAEDFQLINPNTRTCPVFRSQADAELTKRIYRRWPVLWRESTDDSPDENPWKLDLQLMFMMNTDSGIFLNQPAPTALPLYEAKMMHQFDHRWATYRWDASDGATGGYVTEDVSAAQKANPAFTVLPRYWVEERHVLARLSDAPRCVTRAYAEGSNLLHALATWVEAGHQADLLAEMGGPTASTRARIIAAAGKHFEALPPTAAEWLKEKDLAEAATHAPLTVDELAVLSAAPSLAAATRTLLDVRSPRWLMGWRDITNATNERTVIASVVPRAGAGDTLLLMFPDCADKRLYACLLADQNSLVHDFVARQKIGGTHLKYHVKKQITNLPPSAYTEDDLAYIVPRVMELTYTSHDLAPWAADLGHTGAPFGFDPARRAILRAELDATYARLYGLTRDELRYILDPSDTHGADYPSETFRGLKNNDIKAHGEYRTRRLVLEAWDALAARDTRPAEVMTPAPARVSSPDWMDRPLVYPTLPRGRISPALYRASVVPHLMHQAGGELSFARFRRAYWLLTEPQTLLRFAKGEVGREATKWSRDYHDHLEKDQFIPHLRGAIRHDLRFITVDGERRLQLRPTDHLSGDDHAIFDARLALWVAELWPSDEPISPLTSAEEAVIKELELVM